MIFFHEILMVCANVQARKIFQPTKKMYMMPIPNLITIIIFSEVKFAMKKKKSKDTTLLGHKSFFMTIVTPKSICWELISLYTSFTTFYIPVTPKTMMCEVIYLQKNNNDKYRVSNNINNLSELLHISLKNTYQVTESKPIPS